MRSEDWIQGPVLHMLGDDIFEMQVRWVGANNDFPYNARECVRIDFNTPSLTTLTKQDQAQLLKRLPGKTVRCYVNARDLQNILFCEIEIIDQE